MRSFLVATGLLVFAAHVHAQSSTTTKTAAPAPASAEGTAPPLIKTVVDDPNDSPMVRAAKRAVASRQNPGQRRVMSVTASGTQTRGRVAVSSGPVEGPKVPPPVSDAKYVPPPKPPSAQERAAKHQAEVQEKLKRLASEEERIAAELQEEQPEMDEDYIDKRIEEIATERKKLMESTPPPR
jgi:small-conductance mechanosensitive channel